MSGYPPRDAAEHDEPVGLAQAVSEWASAHPHEEPEAEEYDPGPEVDDEGRHERIPPLCRLGRGRAR